jgi:peptidyl-prolyl cis-trans isomerase SurA
MDPHTLSGGAPVNHTGRQHSISRYVAGGSAAAGAIVLAILWLPQVGCKSAVSSDVAATVNGRPITYTELDRALATQLPDASSNQPADQLMALKLEVLRALIDKEILLQRAEKASLLAVDADVEAKFNEFKAPYSDADFQRQLKDRKMSEADLKAQLRKDLSIQKLFNREIGSHISISDAEVEAFYNANKSSFNYPEPRLHFAEILVTPSPDPNVHNLRGTKAQGEVEAKKKIDMIAMRLNQGDDFATLAQNFSEDPRWAASGGDAGFVPESQLDKADPELRKALLSMTTGQVSGPIHTHDGYRLLKMIAKEPAGQRALTDPRVQENIRSSLFNLKDQLLRDAYIEASRNEATVVDYLATGILSNRDKR